MREDVLRLADKARVMEIRGHRGYYITDDGRLISTRKTHGKRAELRKLIEWGNGYHVVNLMHEDGTWTPTLIHFLVAKHFISERPGEEFIIRHLDGDKFNNHYSNLRWGTHVENEADKVTHGTALLGEKSHFAKLSNADVREIRERLKTGKRGTGVQLAKEFGVAKSTITWIRQGKTWGHID